MPFSRRVVNLPRIEDCPQLRNLIIRQGNNLVWWYTQKFENIRFETNAHELDEFFDQNMDVRVQQRTIGKIVSVHDENNTTDDEEDDDEIQWIELDGNSDIIDEKNKI